MKTSEILAKIITDIEVFKDRIKESEKLLSENPDITSENEIKINQHVTDLEKQIQVSHHLANKLFSQLYG